MHLADGLLSPAVWITSDALAVGALAWATKTAGKRLTDRQVPFMGVLGAFVFAAQMVSFPLPGGTSGHLLGAVLLAVLLGPAISSVVMFCVLLVQALLFQDGGLTVIGPNFINMGLMGTCLGWAVYRLVGWKSEGLRRDGGIFLACWLSVVTGSLLTGFLLWLSENAPLRPVLIAMGSVHALVGVVEGVVTVAVVRFLLAARPDLLKGTS
jgi:cobalt/nickel transport system permease protein